MGFKNAQQSNVNYQNPEVANIANDVKSSVQPQGWGQGILDLVNSPEFQEALLNFGTSAMQLSGQPGVSTMSGLGQAMASGAQTYKGAKEKKKKEANIVTILISANH